jgi:hypothetical protein
MVKPVKRKMLRLINATLNDTRDMHVLTIM